MSSDPDDHWSNSPGWLVILSGPSGVGKSTIAARLLERMCGRLERSISVTTRPMRPGEVEGVDYHFVTADEFGELKGDLLESAVVHGFAYGTPAAPARRAMARGRCVLLVIDVQGGLQVMRAISRVVSIFLEPPSMQALETRLRARATEDAAALERRLANARAELLVKSQYQYQVVNDDLDRAVEQITSILSRCGTPEEPRDDRGA